MIYSIRPKVILKIDIACDGTLFLTTRVSEPDTTINIDLRGGYPR